MGEFEVEIGQRFKKSFDPLHALVYFVPETEQALTGAGLRPGRMCYFAGRSAAMGAVGAAVVASTFYNFNPEIITRHIPRAWGLATPEQVLAARLEAVDAAYVRLLGEDALKADDVAEAAELAREAAAGCRAEGRPLYAAHASLEWPAKPHLVLWHAITLLREHRGDGHIAALVLNGFTGLTALFSHTATQTTFVPEAAKVSRGWSDEEWAAAEQELKDAGLVGDDGKLTEDGVALRRRVEEATDAAATGPWLRLGAEKTARLDELCTGLSRRVVKAGAFPAQMFTQGQP